MKISLPYTLYIGRFGTQPRCLLSTQPRCLLSTQPRCFPSHSLNASHLTASMLPSTQPRCFPAHSLDASRHTASLRIAPVLTNRRDSLPPKARGSR
jgi:hypothetical protein